MFEWLTAFGFPLLRGGPIRSADQRALHGVVQVMRKIALNLRDDMSFWHPAPPLAKLAAEGKAFT